MNLYTKQKQRFRKKKIMVTKKGEERRKGQIRNMELKDNWASKVALVVKNQMQV